MKAALTPEGAALAARLVEHAAASGRLSPDQLAGVVQGAVPQVLPSGGLALVAPPGDGTQAPAAAAAAPNLDPALEAAAGAAVGAAAAAAPPARRRPAAAKQQRPAPLPAAGRGLLGGASSSEEEEAPPLRQRLGYAAPAAAAGAAAGGGDGLPDEAGLDRFDIEQLMLVGFSRGACVQVGPGDSRAPLGGWGCLLFGERERGGLALHSLCCTPRVTVSETAHGAACFLGVAS
jgi:hypothetical protein